LTVAVSHPRVPAGVSRSSLQSKRSRGCTGCSSLLLVAPGGKRGWRTRRGLLRSRAGDRGLGSDVTVDAHLFIVH
jgi:hypothetical protein